MIMEKMDLKRLKEAREEIRQDESLILYTRNKKTKIEGCALFHNKEDKLKVFEGSSDGIDDKIITFEEFVKDYDFIVGSER